MTFDQMILAGAVAFALLAVFGVTLCWAWLRRSAPTPRKVAERPVPARRPASTPRAWMSLLD